MTLKPIDSSRWRVTIAAAILGLEQVEQMALGRKNFSVPRTNGGSDVFCLGGFLRDDNLINHDGSFGSADSTAARSITLTLAAATRKQNRGSRMSACNGWWISSQRNCPRSRWPRITTAVETPMAGADQELVQRIFVAMSLRSRERS
jgi:hypothetical protein